MLYVQFKVGTTLRQNGRIMLTVPQLYNPQGGVVQPVIDNSISNPSVTSSTSTSGGITYKAISVGDVSFISSSMSLTIDYSVSNALAAGDWVQFSVTNFLNPINYSPLSGFSIVTYDMQGTGNYALIDQTSTTFSLSLTNPQPQTLTGGAVYVYLTGT